MLLCIDVGNSNISIGLADKEQLINQWRMRTDPNITSDELWMFLSFIFNEKCKNKNNIEIIISSVVPPLDEKIKDICIKYLKKDPFMVTPEVKLGISISYEDPKALGTDRIVNAAGAYARYKKGIIIVDLGTATTFDYVSSDGVYIGGAISPGIITSANALFKHAHKLPKIVKFYTPKSVLAKNTIDSINTGIIYGYACLVDGMIEKIKTEIGDTQIVTIATGGLAHLIKEVSKGIDIVDKTLTLYGLIEIYNLNRKK